MQESQFPGKTEDCHLEQDQRSIVPLGMDFDSFTKKALSTLRDASPMLKILVDDLENVNERIDEIDIHIAEKWETNQYARIIETIPGIGKYGSLAIASEMDS